MRIRACTCRFTGPGARACEYCGAVYVLRDPDPDQPMPMFDNTEIEDAFRRAQQRVRDERGHNE